MSAGVRGGPQKRGRGKANPKFTAMLYQEEVVGRKGTSVHNVHTVQSICTQATCNQGKSGACQSWVRTSVCCDFGHVTSLLWARAPHFPQPRGAVQTGGVPGAAELLQRDLLKVLGVSLSLVQSTAIRPRKAK